MRKFLIIFGWTSVIGSAGDALIGLYALWVIGFGEWQDISISVDAFLKDSLPFLYWVKSVAYYVLPQSAVGWIFAIPALVYFPSRVIISIVIGLWAFSVAKKMGPKKEKQNPSNQTGEAIGTRRSAPPTDTSL